MIDQIKLDNFGPLTGIHWSALGKINLVIGGNGSGKTFLLKAIDVYKRQAAGQRINEQQHQQ